MPAEPSFPLRVVLPDAAAWLAKPHENQIVDSKAPALLQFLASQPSARKTKLEAETLAALIAVMPFLLLLDGFDEVGAVEDRERVVTATREMLTELGQKDARAIVVATTRPQGYAGELSRIGVPLAPKYLAQLSTDAALIYAKKLVEAKIQGADEQERTLERLRVAARETATSRLLRTPLQVTILTALVQQGRAPSERWNLFWSYFDFAYRREIERDTYASKLLADRRGHIQAIHTRVALILQAEAENAGGAAARMSRDRLQSIVDAVLKEDEIADEERADLVRNIVDAAEKRLVFLVEPEPGNFGFEIRSLQEFMAAWALSEGRDASVESRLLQVAKAPLFRNVVLFMASKLFSERSALRDVLADRICGTLDDDPSDALARVTKAGALLALDVLEEGSALTQPKRARALMERAVGLLDLPPAAEHARLARAVTEDTEPVLRAALEARLARGATETTDTRAAWVCIVEATNLGHLWAKEVGEAFWSSLKAPEQMFNAFQNADIPLGRWILTKIEASLEAFPPESVLRAFPGIQCTAEAMANSWIFALVRTFHSHLLQRIGINGVLALPSLLRLQNANQSSLDGLAAIQSPPPNWRAWVAAAKFHGAPSAALLAETLRIAEETLPREEWRRLAHWMPWPLAACLNAAEAPEDLERFADMLSRGELGDTADWYQAEKSWRTGGSLRAVIEAVADGMPWKLGSLGVAPPLAVMTFSDMDTGSTNVDASLLQDANRAFQACRSLIHRELPKLRKIARRRALTSADITGYKIVGEPLWRAQHFKCCYCEHKIKERYNDVEHYRPKGRANREPGCTEIHGYWWLAFTWTNLLLSCPSCNRSRKGDLFPLRLRDTALQREEAPPGGERPYLLDPGAQINPVAHIQFQCRQLHGTTQWFARPRNRSVRGTWTIYVCGLNDANLVELRTSHVERCVQPHADALNEAVSAPISASNRPRVQREFARARGMLDPRSEYVALTYDALRHLVPDATLARWKLSWPDPRDVGR